jgi:chemotaxis regulatin CheY-phosphate phosphatase CheZ
MSDEQYALSPAPSSPPPTEADYEAIFAAVMETIRGRWFLSEFARRNRHADTQMVLAAIDRLQATMHGERADPTFERIRTDIRDMADAIAATRREIAAIRPDREHTGIGEATEELDAIVMATERATSEILAAAETIQEMAWTLREQGLDAKVSDKLDACATDVYLACSFQDLTGQRTRKVIHVLRYLEERINAMVEILGGEAATAPERPARTHDPLDIAMDQAEIDAVMPATPAEHAEAARSSPASPPDTVTPVSPAAMEAGALLDVAPIGEQTPVEDTAAPAPPMMDAPEAVLDLDAEPIPPPATTEGAIEGDAPSTFADAQSRQPDAPLALPTAADEGRDGAMEAPGIGSPEGDTIDLAVTGSDDAERETVGLDEGAMAAEAEATDTTDAPQELIREELIRGVAPNTAALLADLLAIIRPASETDADTDRDLFHNAHASALDADESPIQAMAEYTPSEPLDLRLLQPVTPHSDFVIVSLVPQGIEPAEAAAVDAPAAATNMLAEAEPPASEMAEAEPTASAALEQVADVAPAGILPDAEPVIEAMADPAPTEVVGFVATAEEEPTGIEPEVDPLMDLMVDPAPSEAVALVEAAAELASDLPAHSDTPPEEIGADETLQLGTAEPARLDVASEPATAPAEAEAEAETSSPMVSTAAVEDDPAEPAETIGVVGLDDDLLMAPVDAHALVDPAIGSVTHADMDLLLPAEAAPVIDTVPAIDADTAGDNTVAAPDGESADADMPAAEMPADSFAEETAAVAPEEVAPPVATADEPPSPAADQAPVPPAYAAAFLDENTGERPAEEERVAAIDLAPPLAAAVAPLNASATAALAVLAMSATAAATTDTASGEIVRQETAGHIDPLAAVKALSAEERIALFS